MSETPLARSSSVEHTLHLGVALGVALQPGDVLGLTGTLGAGKTQLVHGIVRGIAEARSWRGPLFVCSPSYTVINTYHVGDVPVHHIDLYRLSDMDDLESTGYWDVLEDPDAIVLIEWLSLIDGAAPESYLELFIDLEDVDDPHRSARIFRLVDTNAQASRLRLEESVYGVARV